jgi:hypothetical protein
MLENKLAYKINLAIQKNDIKSKCCFKSITKKTRKYCQLFKLQLKLYQNTGQGHTHELPSHAQGENTSPIEWEYSGGVGTLEVDNDIFGLDDEQLINSCNIS